MANTVQQLPDILALEPLEHNLFRGRSPRTGFRRVFGGLAIAQALMAAGRTVEGRAPHSLHAYFLLAGDPETPIDYQVERIRDGSSFATRRVTAMQHGKAILSLAASFHVEEEGFEHQIAMPDVPSPEELLRDHAAREALVASLPEPARRYFTRERPVELVPVDLDRYRVPAPRPPLFRMWLRCVAPLPSDPLIHRCALAYASDMGLLDAALIPHGRSVFSRSIQAASLDHALWFHRPFRADEWILYSQDSPNANGARGFSRGQFFTRDGTLIASVAQEGLIRKRDPNFEKKKP